MRHRKVTPGGDGHRHAPRRITEIVHGTRRGTADTALRLARFFGPVIVSGPTCSLDETSSCNETTSAPSPTRSRPEQWPERRRRCQSVDMAGSGRYRPVPGEYHDQGVTMSTVQYDVTYSESRSRLTTLIRIILAIPHLVIANLLLRVAQVLAVIQWIIILFTGKRNQGLFDLQSQWLAYGASTYSYVGVMFDQYPPFVTVNGLAALRYDCEYRQDANRLTNLLRIIWAIPAMIIGTVLVFLGTLVTIISWITIVITGKHPRGMFDFLVKVHRYAVRLNAYLLLMTDTYPKYE